MGGGGGFLSKYNSEFFIDVIRLEFGKGLFALSTLGPVAVLFRRMLKTWVTLGHICLVLLNLIKTLIFVMFIESSSPSLPPHQCSSSLFCSPITAACHLNFCSLAPSVWLVTWYVFSTVKSLFIGCLWIVLVHGTITRIIVCIIVLWWIFAILLPSLFQNI